MENKDHFHLEKNISVGHLLTTGTLAVAALFYISNIDQKIEVLKTRIYLMEERFDREGKLTNEILADIRNSMNRIETRQYNQLEKQNSTPIQK